MSPATDGFSAMTSFLAMGGAKGRRGYPQSARCYNLRRKFVRSRARPRAWKAASGASGRQARGRGREEILGDQLAGRRLLVPEHHQNDELELLERQLVTVRGERSLDHVLAHLGAEDARMLEMRQQPAALGRELLQLARGIGAACGPRGRQRRDRA